jgi:antitoxin component YwqK of YwqJK toxin-antitoxin module
MWRRPLFLSGALLLTAAAASAQQSLSTVELAQPIGAAPIWAAPTSGDGSAPSVPGKPAPAAPAPIEAQVSDGSTADEGDQTPATLPEAEPNTAAVSDEPKVEVVTQRYPNGVVRIEREVTLDAEGSYIPHGLWRQFDPTGRPIAEGRYVQSHKEGIWRRLYRGDDAPLLATAPYRDFTPPFVSQATFSRGNLHGKWTVTDAKQRKIHELEFVAGERHGQSTWFYPSGQIMLQARYEHGAASGEVLQYGPDASVVAKEIYEEGRKLAPKIEYYDPQQLAKKSEAMYLHAALVVKTPDNWDTATLAVFESRGRDEKHGPYTAWHKNGQLSRQGEFRYDLPVGKFIYWFSNGQKQMEGTYADGRQEGSWTWWHENGLKSIAGEYRDATPIGVWSWWLASGKLAQKADLSEKSIAGPMPEAEESPREAKIRLAEPVVEVR